MRFRYIAGMGYLGIGEKDAKISLDAGDIKIIEEKILMERGGENQKIRISLQGFKVEHS